MVVGGCYSGLSGHKSKKVTSSERSASQIYHVTQRLMARSRRTPRALILPVLLGAFQPPKPVLFSSEMKPCPWSRDVPASRTLGFYKIVERETGIEPATNGLGSRYSTIELLPQWRSPILPE